MTGPIRRAADTRLMLFLWPNTYIFPCLHKIISEGETGCNSGVTSLLSSPLPSTRLLPPNSTQLQDSIALCRQIWNPLAGDKELNILWEWPHLGVDLRQTYCKHCTVMYGCCLPRMAWSRGVEPQSAGLEPRCDKLSLCTSLHPAADPSRHALHAMPVQSRVLS